MPRGTRSIAALALAFAAVVLSGCGGDAGSGDGMPSPTSTAAGPSDGSSAPSAEPTTTLDAAGDGSGIVLEEDYSGTGTTVALLGDSITVQGHQHLRAALPDHALRVAAVRGEGFASGAYSRSFGQQMMLDAAAELAATSPEVAVVALGTNDAWTPDGTLPAALDALDTIVGDLEETCLVAVLVDDGAPAEEFDVAAAQEINQRISASADEVVDWPAVAREEGVLQRDGIHPTPAGQQRWAEAVAEGVEACTT